MKRLFVLAGLLGCLLSFCANAEAQDDDYVQIYNLIQDADALNNSSQFSEALTRYIQARTTLQRFQRVYPDWNRAVVEFRLNYLAARITEVSEKAPTPETPAVITRPHAAAPLNPPLGTAERSALEGQVGTLQNQVQTLQADKQALEAKLKEALAAQPAASDPRELAKARDRILSLEKENGLLQVSVEQRQAKTAAPEDAKTAERLEKDLAAANQRLAEQARRADVLAAEKGEIQTKLNSLISAPWNSSKLKATQKALDDANRKLAEQAELASRASRDKDGLAARVKALEADAEAMSALRAENAILKKQLTDLKSPASAASIADVSRQLAEARVQIAALESDKEILRLEKIALQGRVKQLMVPPPAAPAVPAIAAAAPEESSRIKQLERDRDDLQKKLEAAQKELYGRKSKGAAATIEDLTGQLTVLRARLAVFETQQVPFTGDELALFKKSRLSLEAADPRAGQKSVHELPSGTAALAAQARRDFEAKDFDKAEQKYLQILRKDEKNIYTLANLAAIQLELNHLDEAEKHSRQAVALNPSDSYSLLVLGQIQFRREKYDESLDALSRAAKLDPQNAEIQNCLGLTLSQKGMRSAAETAFRKAVQLDPSSGSAHHNLAVFYATQRPPWPELARWHYKKAIDAGFPRNRDLEKMLQQAQ